MACDTQHNDIHNNGTQHNDTQHNKKNRNTQHNNSQRYGTVLLNAIYDEYHYTKCRGAL